MFFGPETLPLDLADKNTRIHIELTRYEIEAIDDFDKDIQFQYRKNIVLTYYNYDDAHLKPLEFLLYHIFLIHLMR
jgi:hypothetical protein